MARGEGCAVEDVDGNIFLDCSAGIAVTATGHSHPDVVKAIVDQAHKFLHMSGTEANEAALKLAKYYTKRHNVIAFLGAFHGRSMGSLALTASKIAQRKGFGPFVPGTYHAPY